MKWLIYLHEERRKIDVIYYWDGISSLWWLFVSPALVGFRMRAINCQVLLCFMVLSRGFNESRARWEWSFGVVGFLMHQQNFVCASFSVITARNAPHFLWIKFATEEKKTFAAARKWNFIFRYNTFLYHQMMIFLLKRSFSATIPAFWHARREDRCSSNIFLLSIACWKAFRGCLGAWSSSR